MKRLSLTVYVLVIIALILGACRPSSTDRSRRVETRSPAIPDTLAPTVQPAPQSQVLSEDQVDEIVNRILGQLHPIDPVDPTTAGLVGSPDQLSEYNQFVNFVSSKVDKYWTATFANANRSNEYGAPGMKIVQTETFIYGGSYTRDAAKGPFYHPASNTIYLPEPEFYDKLWRIDSKMTNFAGAYLIAHEWGHHIQNVVGVWDNYLRVIENANTQTEKNFLTQRMELQADCLGGAWANGEYYAGSLEAGDIEQAIALAIAIGDDVLGGKTDPTTMDHGTGELRQAWFMYGYNTGDPSMCDYVWSDNQQGQSNPTPDVQRPEPTNTPAVSSQNLVQSFFELASDPSCKMVEDEVAHTVTTYRCSFSDNTGKIVVDYDEWVGEQAWLEMVNNVRDQGQALIDDTWNSKGNESIHGPYVAWTSSDDNVTLMWGVDAYRLTGTLYWYNNNVNAAVDWFLKQGSRHYVNP